MKDTILNILRKIKCRRAVPVQPPETAEVSIPNAELVENEIDYLSKGYLPDTPKSSRDSDRLNRWPFAKRIAETIASQKGARSIIIGIFGEWGMGKTSVLNFIDQNLRDYPGILIIRFNPWYFTDQSKLINDYFSLLARAIGKSLRTTKEDFGNLMIKYSSMLNLSISPFPDSPVSIPTGDVVAGFGSILSHTTLEELKLRIENILAKERIRVVVLMDDIDRLDKDEIYMIFRLVKLTGDLPFVSYVLSFDYEMVADCMRERYGERQADAGESFLDKIIQVPLRLPKADESSLRQIFLEGIEKVLKLSAIEISESDARRFIRSFDSALSRKIQNIRVIKLYLNSLIFCLPLVKGEVNIVDLLLIEGIKVLYPNLYNAIRENKDHFLALSLRYPSEHAKIDDLKAPIKAVIDQCLSGLTEDERNSIIVILKDMFPRLHHVYDNTIYGPGWDEQWAKERMISSEIYFDHYFSYSISIKDFSDIKLEMFLSQVSNKSSDEIIDDIKRNVTSLNAEIFISKLWDKVDKLSQRDSVKIALSLSKCGDIFPNPESWFPFANPFYRAAILVGNLLKKITRQDGRIERAKDILAASEPLNFAFEIFQFMRPDDKSAESDQLLTKNEEVELAKILLGKIVKIASKSPIYINSPRDAPNLLGAWALWGSRQETDNYLRDTFEQDPYNVLKFLKCFVPSRWGMESGLPTKGNIDKRQYDWISNIVDPDIVYLYLTKLYGSELDDPKYMEIDNRPVEIKVAHGFSFWHRKAKEKQTPAKKSEK